MEQDKAPMTRRRYAQGVAAGYALFATGWIILSDRALDFLVDPLWASRLSLAKGLLFVAITSYALFIALEAVPPDGGTIVPRGARGPVTIRRMIAALTMPLLAFAIQWLLWEELQPYVWFLFYPAVFFSSWLGGLPGGLAATVVSTLLVWYVFIPVQYSFALQNPYSAVSIGIFFMMGLLFAITHERLRQAESRAADAKFRAVVDQSLAGIYIIQGGVFRYVNPAFAAMFGYASPAEIVERVTVESLVDPDHRALVTENIRKRMTGEVSEVRYRIICRRIDGSRFPVEIHGRSFRYNDRPAVIGIAFDIDERERAEQARLKSEQRLRLALAASNTGVWEWEAESGTAFWSPECAAIFGVPPPEVFPTGLIDRTHPEDRNRFQAEIKQALNLQAAFVDEVRILASDGEVRWIAVQATPLCTGGGRPDRLIGTVRNVTQRRRVQEDLLRQAKELRQRNEELERFNRAMVGRELDLIEMKKRMNRMTLDLGGERPFPGIADEDGDRPAVGGIP